MISDKRNFRPPHHYNAIQKNDILRGAYKEWDYDATGNVTILFAKVIQELPFGYKIQYRTRLWTVGINFPRSCRETQSQFDKTTKE